MFSFDNFLINNMPVKSRFMFDKFCDPQLAYWPDDFYLCRPRKRKNTKNLYNRFINGLIDEILDPNSQSDVEMEIEYEPKKKQIRNQPVEKSANQENNKIECPSIDKESNSNSVKTVEKVNEKEVTNQNKDLQLTEPTEINLRVGNYKPEDISVQIKDGRLTIRGKKELKNDSVFCCQKFERTFTLSETVDQQNISCQMDANGSIKLNLPNKQQQAVEQPKEEEIKITREENNDNRKEETEVKTVDDDEPKVEDLIEP